MIHSMIASFILYSVPFNCVAFYASILFRYWDIDVFNVTVGIEMSIFASDLDLFFVEIPTVTVFSYVV